MRVLEFPGYGPSMPRVYLPLDSIISFKLIDFNGDYGRRSCCRKAVTYEWARTR